MIDPSRWILAEAWLALGLRLEWAPKWERLERDQLIDDEELHRTFYYEGGGVWRVLETDRGYRAGTRPTAPELGTDAMRHELAHYLAASAEERARRNFGLTTRDSDAEERALEVEQVIDAMSAAASRIASLAMAGRR